MPRDTPEVIDLDTMRALFANAGATTAGALPARQKPPPREGKPAFWWATDLAPWQRVSAPIGKEKVSFAATREAKRVFVVALTRVAVKAAEEGDWE